MRADFRFSIFDFRLGATAARQPRPVADFRFSIFDFRLGATAARQPRPVAGFRFSIFGFRLGAARRPRPVPYPKFQISNFGFRSSRLRAGRFTLIELLIAIAILGLALSTTVLYLAHAQRDLLVARDEWQDQHALANATEYALLMPVNSLDIPADLLPPGYRAECRVVEVADQLPEFAIEPHQGWMLMGYEIAVYSPGGRTASHLIYKLLRTETP